MNQGEWSKLSLVNMPAPIFKGTFPVKASESTRYFDRGKIEYAVTNITSLPMLLLETSEAQILFQFLAKSLLNKYIRKQKRWACGSHKNI
ncbi:hypothetical protein EBQ91_00865 [bacterium]|nr:hypothetical protein [bacterium]